MTLPKWVEEHIVSYGHEICDEKDCPIYQALAVAIEALEKIKGVGDSFGPDHPMPISTYLCGAEAVTALAEIERMGEKK